MVNLVAKKAEAYSREAFHCASCNHDFEAEVITWVDVTKTPQARYALLKWDFNIIRCPRCGCRHFSGTPFFYEDFEEGFLIAVFPSIPEKRGEVERSIRAKYGYYPILEYFYDMTQIWMLIYFLEHYKMNRNLRTLSRIGEGEVRVRRMLRFLKEDRLMIDIREKLTETFFNEASHDELIEVLGRAVYTLEEMLPWPMDRRCRCGADLAKGFSCCNRRIDLNEHEMLLSRHYIIYCTECGESLTGASCEQCGQVYTWKLGIVPSYGQAAAVPVESSHTGPDSRLSP